MAGKRKIIFHIDVNSAYLSWEEVIGSSMGLRISGPSLPSSAAIRENATA